MKRKILLLVLSGFFIIFIAGYLATTASPYSDIAISIAGWFAGAIIVLAIKTIFFKRNISEYDISALAVIVLLLSLSSVISNLFLHDSPPLVNALTNVAFLFIGGIIALKIFYHANSRASSPTNKIASSSKRK